MRWILSLELCTKGTPLDPGERQGEQHNKWNTVSLPDSDKLAYCRAMPTSVTSMVSIQRPWLDQSEHLHFLRQSSESPGIQGAGSQIDQNSIKLSALFIL